MKRSLQDIFSDRPNRVPCSKGGSLPISEVFCPARPEHRATAHAKRTPATASQSIMTLFGQEAELRRVESLFFGSSLSDSKSMRAARRAFVLRVLHPSSVSGGVNSLIPSGWEEFEHAFLVSAAREAKTDFYILPKALLGSIPTQLHRVDGLEFSDYQKLCDDADGCVYLVVKLA